MSKVETAKMPMFASASGAVNDARTPTKEKSIAPATRKQRHPFSALTSAGTDASGQTTESSSWVRVIEKNPPWVAHGGGPWPGP